MRCGPSGRNPGELAEALGRGPWDLVLADSGAGDIGPAHALRILRERRLDPAFIVIASADREDMALAAMREGAHDYVLRDDLRRLVPAVDRELLAASVRQDRRCARDELQTTAQHGAISSQRASERFAQSILDAIPESVFLMNTGGVVLAANATYARRVGRPLADCIGTSTYDFVGPAVAARRREWVAEAIRTGQPIVREDQRDGWWTVHSIYPIRGDGGRVERVVVFAMDITASRATETALRQSEERLRAILDSIPDPAWLKDGSLQFLAVNKAWCRLFDLSAAHATGRRTAEILPGPLAERFEREDLRVVSSGHDLLYEELVRGAENRDTWFETHKSPLVDGAGRIVGIAGIARDITKRKETLQASEERFRRVFQHSAAGMVLVSPDACFLQANDAFCRMLGYAESELLGKTFQDVTLPEDRPVGGELTRRALSGEVEVFHLEKRYLRKDGTVIWGFVSSTLIRDGQNKPQHFVTQILDLTERKRAEEAVRASERRFRELADLLPQTIFEADRSGRLTFVNKYAEQMFGYELDVLQKGLSISDVIFPEDRARAAEAIAAILQGRTTSGNSYTAVRKDGTTFAIMAYSAYPSRGKSRGDTRSARRCHRSSPRRGDSAEAAGRNGPPGARGGGRRDGDEPGA